ncbi:hypothetical protein L596_003924 [Steinernema carpocapsae]|uniref:Uncharacterized protein n=1 Tax=Steinernema carpocapsae TaxID=34508 RepID=A0A4U8UY66_STECR|nr:hypothetical protein L596_003924 [Steinernema carpocapsae]
MEAPRSSHRAAPVLRFQPLGSQMQANLLPRASRFRQLPRIRCKLGVLPLVFQLACRGDPNEYADVCKKESF